MTFSIWNTPPDHKTLIISYEVQYFVDQLRSQIRARISTPADAQDKDYSQTIIETTVDKCNFYRGIYATFLSRVIGEHDTTKSHNCPIPKFTTSTVINQTISDTFIFPMSVETRYKMTIKNYAIIKGRKGWVFLYDTTIFARYSKQLLG